MSDTITHLVVSTKDLSETQATELINAILQFRNVVGVRRGAADPASWAAESRVKADLREKIIGVVYP